MNNCIEGLKKILGHAEKKGVIIQMELLNSKNIFVINLDHRKDIELLISQVERCENILKKLTIDPLVKDDFINQNLSLADYVKEIIKSFEEISKKMFVIDKEKYTKIAQLQHAIAC